MVGVPKNIRRESEASLVGNAVSMLPLLVAVHHGDVTDALVKRTSSTMKRAREHSRIPLLMIIDALQIRRTPAHHDLYQTIVQWGLLFDWGGLGDENTIACKLGNTALRLARVQDTTSHVDISLIAAWVGSEPKIQALRDEATGVVSGKLLFRTDLFAKSTVASLAERFLILSSKLVIFCP